MIGIVLFFMIGFGALTVSSVIIAIGVRHHWNLHRDSKRKALVHAQKVP